MSEQRKVCINMIKTHHHSIKFSQSCSGQPSNAYTVEKMTATSTTSPKTDPSNDNEDREIQNALDKKRKKRIKHSNSKDSKHIKVEGRNPDLIHDEGVYEYVIFRRWKLYSPVLF